MVVEMVRLLLELFAKVLNIARNTFYNQTNK